MAGLSLKVLLQLQTKEFNKAVKQVESQLKGFASSIKNIAGMMVGGLGLNQLISHFRDTARQMSVVKATMENVSDGYREYAENMEFVRRIAGEYGQEMVSLAEGFAKFHAAAKQTTLTLEQQKNIYEALTRASGAFHLSADQTRNVMMAVEQMMSKGKVASEELRRQLGNTLPGAFNLMAQAAGMAGITVNGTTAELEEMMKKGKVLAQDVLPQFAQVLNKTTATASFDSLQSSLNRFQNAWTQFVDNSGFETIFKTLVDTGTNALKKMSDEAMSFGRIMANLGAVFVGVFAGPKIIPFVQAFTKASVSVRQTANEVKALEARQTAANERVQRAQEMFRRLGNQAKVSIGGIAIRFDDIEKEILMTDATMRRLLTTMAGADGEIQKITVDSAYMAQVLKNGQDQFQKELDESVARLKQEQLELDKLRNEAGAKFSAIGTAIKSVLSMVAFTAILTVVTNIVGKIAEMYKEWKKFHNLAKDSKQAIEDSTASVNEQIARMNVLKKTVEDTRLSEETRKKALGEINQLLGTQTFTMEDLKNKAELVNVAIGSWKTGLIDAARAAAYTSKLIELEAKKIDLEGKIASIRASGAPLSGTTVAGGGNSGYVQYVEGLTSEGWKLRGFEEQIEQVNNAIKTLENQMNGEVTERFEKNLATANSVMGEYKKSLNNLQTQLKAGKISQSQFNEESKHIADIARNAITSLHDWSEVVKSFSGDYADLWKNIQRLGNTNSGGGGGGAGKGTDGLVKALDKFAEAKSKLDTMLENKTISEEEYTKELDKICDRYKDDVLGLEDLTERLAKLPAKYRDIFEAMKNAIEQVSLAKKLEEDRKEHEKQMKEMLKKQEAFNKKANELLAGGIPKNGRRGGRNERLDYRRTSSSILGADAGDAEDLARTLESVIDKVKGLDFSFDTNHTMLLFLMALEAKLQDVQNEANNLRDLEAFAKMTEDVKRLSKELKNVQWDAWNQGTVGALQSIHGSLGQIMSDLEGLSNVSNPFEFIGTTLDLLGDFNSIIDTVIRSIQTWNTVMETTNELQRAQQAQTQMLGAMTVSALGAEGVAETTSATLTKSAEKAKRAEISKTILARTGEAVAGAASSVSWLPIVGPALAAAAVAGIVALLAANTKKFSRGGFVGGNSKSGDHNLISANSGELVLTTGQQKNLFEMIKSGHGVGGNVAFKIRGADLIGVMENERSRRRG